jgi:uncharacterized protein YceK
MRQFALVAFLTAILFLLSGCNRSSTHTDSSQSASQSSQSFLQSSDQTEFAPRGFAAIQYAPVYDLSSGRPEWIGAPDFGEVLEFYQSEDSNVIKNDKAILYKPKNAVIDGSDVFLIPVLWKGNQGWVDVSHYAPENSRIGAVVETFEVQTLNEGDITFRRGDLVVFDSSSSRNILYAPIYGVWVNDAVSRKQISLASDDVETAKLLVKSKNTRNSEQARELLLEATRKYPNSTLYSLITEALNPQASGTESLVTFFSIAVDQTAVYAAPDFSSAIMVNLEQYIDVKTNERTTVQATTRDGSSRWYHIIEPAEGWVFGLYLEGAD